MHTQGEMNFVNNELVMYLHYWFLTKARAFQVTCLYIANFLMGWSKFNTFFDIYFLKLTDLQTLTRFHFLIRSTRRSSTNWTKMQSNHFHYVVVNDHYKQYFVEIEIRHLWACVRKNSFTFECFLKINTRIYLCFKYRAMLNNQQYLGS